MPPYYVYFSNQCRNDAQRHSVDTAVAKFAAKLQRDQNTLGLDRFPPPYLKKPFGKQGRLLIEEHRRPQAVVLCLARYLIRGSTDYASFLNDTEEYYNQNCIPENEITNFLNSQLERTDIPGHQPLSLGESAYLQFAPPSASDHQFMESYTWFERITESWAQDYLSSYYELVFRIAADDCPPPVAASDTNANVRIMFRTFPRHNCTFLIAPIKPTAHVEDQQHLTDQYNDVLTLPNVDLDEITRRSRRAYPSTITYDDRTWFQVQKSVEANLALSPEEAKILRSARTSSDGPRYPLFINGRPGSGKSTILQYLFAGHLEQYISLASYPESAMAGRHPLYLTYSQPLLTEARSSITNILTCGAGTLGEGEQPLTGTRLKKALDSSMWSFRHFLLFLLPASSRQRFSPANYVDFYRFRQHWEDVRRKHPTVQVRTVGSELAWHVIRTFIKGMYANPESTMDPQYYAKELPRTLRSVSSATFELIYQHSWQNWYSRWCDEHDYWDDQDLTRAVLTLASNSQLELSCYPAIFCDESQDFTAIELELIEQLSLYSDRDVAPHLLKHVPFVFAGDPFQTLNPTGFNWDAMQSSFHMNIVQQLDRTGRAMLEFNFQELSFNYRSSTDIVKLANSVQLLRAVLLDTKGLRPQHVWARSHTTIPAWFRGDDADCQAAIRDQDELVIIVPCQENGELTYVQSDSFLRDIALDGDKMTRNILSPARAKGLEYDRVLLYGFGDAAIARLPNLVMYIEHPEQETPGSDERLSWEYFLNQFYVAVTRARKRLFIVDSECALQQFWSFTDVQKQRELLGLYDSPNDWNQTDLGGHIQGARASWSDDRDKPIDLAKRWQLEGRAKRDSYLLNLAKTNFERAGQPEKARFCEAEAYEYSNDFVTAGKLFATLRQAQSACRCYWAAAETRLLVELAEDFPEMTNDPRYILAYATNRNTITTQSIEDVIGALEQMDSELLIRPETVNALRASIAEFIRKMIETPRSSGRDVRHWASAVGRLTETIERFSLPAQVYARLAELYYCVGEAALALRHWEECGETVGKEGPKWVTYARAETAEYPENVRYFRAVNEHRRALEAWRKADQPTDDDPKGAFRNILESAIEVSDFGAVNTLLPFSDDMTTVARVLEKALEVRDVTEVILKLGQVVPLAIVRCLEAKGRLEQIVKFCKETETRNSKVDAALKNLPVKWNGAALLAAAAMVLARSDRLAAERPSKLAKFLRESFIVERGASELQRRAVGEIHKFVSLMEIGAAFERAFRLTFALEYYEQWFDNRSPGWDVLSSCTRDEEEFGRRRWVICKRRLAIERDGHRHARDAERGMRSWGLSGEALDNEPEYPALEPLGALETSVWTVSKAGKIQPKQRPVTMSGSGGEDSTPKARDSAQAASGVRTLSIEGREFTAELFGRKGRVVLTDKETESQIRCEAESVRSDDLEVESVPGIIQAVTTWRVKDWNLCCDIEAGRRVSTIRFRTEAGVTVGEFEVERPTGLRMGER